MDCKLSAVPEAFSESENNENREHQQNGDDDKWNN